VIDCGGGTVDIVAHRADLSRRPFTLNDVVRGDGDCCGGVFVDQNFFKFVEAHCGTASWQKICEPKNTKHYSKFLKAWEETKRSFNEEDAANIRVDLPSILSTGFKKECPDADPDSTEDHSCLPISIPDFKNFHNDAITKTCHLAQAMLNDPAMAGCRRVLVIGGLAASTYFSPMITKSLSAYHVSIPPDSAASVLRGACLISRFPETFSTRCMREIIGICSAQRSIATDPVEARIVYGGLEYSKNVLDRFIEIGQIVQCDHRVSRTYHVKGGQSTRLDLYASTNRDARFVSDPDVWHLCTINYQIQTSFASPTLVTVDFIFGRTLFEVFVSSSTDPNARASVEIQFPESKV
jgi:hypothetical protein